MTYYNIKYVDILMPNVCPWVPPFGNVNVGRNATEPDGCKWGE